MQPNTKDNSMIDTETGEIVGLEQPNRIKLQPFVRSAYNYDMDEASHATGLKCVPDGADWKEHTVTQQQFAEEVDINTIIERFGLGYELPEAFKIPLSGDFADARDYQSTLNLQIEARNAFMTLPAALREEFANDPARLIQFIENPENKERAAKLGLLKEPPKPVEPVMVRVMKDEETPTN